ncbi:MAG: carboxy-S-adenosyl-L-methionine synthase CmoA [Pseudomonadales bacterium]|nr:carboxy-S-adenosyl-L-methionine synthase CmoA [Pseudomonadales bacterium]
MKKDQIYASPRKQIDAFQFDDAVAEVFSDMIVRSVPGYRMMLEMIGVIAREFSHPNTTYYDLGCSLGAATLSIRHNLAGESCRIIAVDNALAMVDRCREIIKNDSALTPVEVRCEDILSTQINNASLVVMNFTLMFIPPEQRLTLLRNIYQGLNPGGVLVLSEKMKEPDELDQELLTELYHRFKRLRGYSELEVAQKRSALEKVLIPEPIEHHRERLKQAGFGQITSWYKCFGFTSLIATK